MCYEPETSKQKDQELISKFNGNKRNQIRVNKKMTNKKIKKNMGIKNSSSR